MSDVIAIFSDVHSNLEALRAVFADMDKMGIQRRYCLGDIVGYGPDPGACLDLIRETGCPALKGNHDAAVAAADIDSEAEGNEMNTSALAGVEFAREELSDEQRTWLAQLPFVIREDDAEFVHGSLDAPEEWWYVLGPEDALLHFEAQTRPLCFCGHTHDPMLWHTTARGKLSIRRGVGRILVPADGKTLVNVGSVGQPRDLNPDACYVIYDPVERWVQFQRVPYDIRQTKRKISQAGLPYLSAKRLSEGK